MGLFSGLFGGNNNAAQGDNTPTTTTWLVQWYEKDDQGRDVHKQDTVTGGYGDLDNFKETLKAAGTPAYTWQEVR